MTAIAATEAEVVAALEGVAGVSVAAVNGPSSVVVSGDADAVEEVAEQFRAQQRRVKRLRVSHAFHSHRMDPVLDELGQVAAGLEFAAPAVPWACGLTGELVTQCEPGYWVRQAREPVRFAAAVAALAAQEISVFLEIGPDGTLSALGPAALPGAGDEEAVFIPALRPGQPATAAVTAALARAHVHGAPVDWTAVLPAGRRIDLPTYAFCRQRYWPQPGPAPAGDDTAGGSPEALFTVEWVRIPAQAAAVGGRWAVLGADRPGLAQGLAEVGVPVRAYADLAALTEAVDAVSRCRTACWPGPVPRPEALAPGQTMRPARRGWRPRGRWAWCSDGWPRSGCPRRGWWW